ncbi:MAG: hypothetical protein ACE5HS_10375 [bacterium]
MKEILLVGNQSPENSILKYVTNPTKFKVKKTTNLQRAQKILEKTSPDFVLCLGKIKVTAQGKYFLEI